MSAPVPAFEVVLDHNDDRHHERMAALLPELQAWAAKHGVRFLQREELELRPGVVRVRFTPDRKAAQAAAQQGRDSLALSPNRPQPASRPNRPDTSARARRPAAIPGRSIQR